MNKKKILIIILIIISAPNYFSQKIKWENLSVGIIIQNYKTNSDLNEFWEESLGGGGAVKYRITKNLFLEGNLVLSKFNSENINYADFILVSMPAGLHYKFSPNSPIDFGLFVGLENNSFIFTGEASDRIRENDTESEFGIFGGGSLSFFPASKIEIEAFYKIQNIFSSPVELLVQNFGVKLFLRNIF